MVQEDFEVGPSPLFPSDFEYLSVLLTADRAAGWAGFSVNPPS